MAKIKLQSSDGDVFAIDLKAAMRSATIGKIVHEINAGEGSVLALYNVNSAILKKVIEWLEHHQDDVTENEVSEWDVNFFQVDQKTVFDIILAANHFDIKDLLDIGCKVVANMLIGKSPDQIKEVFNV